MSEQLYDPSAEEIYSDYTQAYFNLEEASHTLPEGDSETYASIARMDGLVSRADIDIDTRQEFLSKIAILKSVSMSTRLKYQQLNVIVAAHALGSEEIISAGIYARKKDKWHEEAIEEDELRSQG